MSDVSIGAPGQSLGALDRLLLKLTDAADALPPAERSLVMSALLPELDAGDRLRVEVPEEDLITPAELALVDHLDESLERPTVVSRALTLIVKGTRLCNLRCSYCNDWRAGPNQSDRKSVV